MTDNVIARPKSLIGVLDELPLGPLDRRITVVLSAIFFFELADLNTFAYAAPALRDHRGFSLDDIAHITSGSFVGMAFGALIGGRVADRLGRKRSLEVSVFWFSIFLHRHGVCRGVLLPRRMLGDCRIATPRSSPLASSLRYFVGTPAARCGVRAGDQGHIIGGGALISDCTTDQQGGPRVQPLEGITVVSVEQAVAAPFATRQLADLGARVIKVERPGAGDFARGYDETVHGLSSHFVWLNRSKESIALDLKDSADLAVLHELVAGADVFVQNLAPGAADRLGLSAKELRAANPRLVHVGISGYGDGGPFTTKKAYDLLIQCESGLVSITGTPDQPAKVGISAADIAAGMYCYTGILTALFQRERTGEGAELTISMLEALGEWMGFPMNYAVYGGTPPPRSGASHAAIAPYGPFHCDEGKQVFLGLQNEREWATFCHEVLHDSAMASDERFSSNSSRVAHRHELTAAIEQDFAALSAQEVVQRLEAAGIANAQLRDLHEFAEHPQLAARDRWRDVETPAGPIRALVPPATFAGLEQVMGAVPALGEHSDAIRAELAARAAGAEEVPDDRR